MHSLCEVHHLEELLLVDHVCNSGDAVEGPKELLHVVLRGLLKEGTIVVRSRGHALNADQLSLPKFLQRQSREMVRNAVVPERAHGLCRSQ